MTTSRTPLRIAARAGVRARAARRPAAVRATRRVAPGYPAVALFVERARAAKGSFELTPANAAAVAADLPAPRRAAAGARARRRAAAAPVAGGAARAARPCARRAHVRAARHARAAADAARHDRLEPLAAHRVGAAAVPPHGRLRRRLHVRRLEAVCADPGESVLDELESLVDKALVQVDGQGDRLRMLQTIARVRRRAARAAGETDEIALTARAPLRRARPRDPRRHRGHRPDRLARARHRRGGQHPGGARHAARAADGDDRRMRGGPAAVRRPA